MAEIDNNSGLLNESPIPDLERSSSSVSNSDIWNAVPERMPTTDVSSLSDNAYLPSSPMISYKARMEEGKRFSETFPERVERQLSVSYQDRLMDGNPMAEALSVKNAGPILIRPAMASETHNILNFGQFQPNFPTYMRGVDNEDRLARGQSNTSKWWNGSVKLLGKTAVNTLGTIIGGGVGLANVINEGSFSAMYNNDFMKWMDDLNSKMDYNLPNYYSKKEKEYGFLRSMWTANFWANDFFQGVSFTAGAMLGTLAIGAVTGGLGAAAGLSRLATGLALRTAGRGVAGAAARAGATGVSRAAANASRAWSVIAKKEMRDFAKLSLKSKLIGGAQIAKFAITSSGYESMVEANGFMTEAENEFIDGYKSQFLREPTADEMAEFRASKSSAGNSVFAANMGILSISNLAMYGAMLGVKGGVLTRPNNLWDRAVGGLAVKNVKGGAPFEYALRGTGKVRSKTGHLLVLGKNVFTEGVFEEGLQGVASSAAKEWVGSRFNPSSLSDTVSTINAIKEGFHHSYGTKEGRKEIGIGMIIGGMFGVRANVNLARRRAGAKELIKSSGLVNAKLGDQLRRMNLSALTPTQLATLSHVMDVSAMINAAEKAEQISEEAQKKGESPGYEYTTMLNEAIFQRLNIDQKAGMLGSSEEFFNLMIDQLNKGDVSGLENFSDEEFTEYQDFLKGEMKGKIEDIKLSQAFAERVMEGFPKSMVMYDFVNRTAFLGLNSVSDMESAAQTIENMLPPDFIGFAQSLHGTSDSSDERLKVFGRIVEIEEQSSDILNKIADLQSRLDMHKAHYSENTADEAGKKQSEKLLVELAELQDQYTQFQIEGDRLTQNLNTFNHGSSALRSLKGISYDNDALTLLEHYKLIEKFRKSIYSNESIDKNVRAALEAEMYRYKSAFKEYRSINEFVNGLADSENIHTWHNAFRDEIAKEKAKLGIDAVSEDRVYELTRMEELSDLEDSSFSVSDKLELTDARIDEMVKNGKMNEEEGDMYKILNHTAENLINGDPRADKEILPNKREFGFYDYLYAMRELTATDFDFSHEEWLMDVAEGAARVLYLGDILPVNVKRLYDNSDVFKREVDKINAERGLNVVNFVTSNSIYLDEFLRIDVESTSLGRAKDIKESVSETDKTEEEKERILSDIDKFEELVEKKHTQGITEDESQRYDELHDRINNDNAESSTDAAGELEVAVLIEKRLHRSPVSPDAANDTELNRENMMDVDPALADVSLNESGMKHPANNISMRKNTANNTLSYVQRTTSPDSQTEMFNITGFSDNIAKFLDSIGVTDPVVRKKMESVLSVSKYGIHKRIRIDKTAFDKIFADDKASAPIVFPDARSASNFGILRLNKEGAPVVYGDSTFAGEKINDEALSRVKKGDFVDIRFEVDEQNRKLLEGMRKAQTERDAAQALFDSITESTEEATVQKMDAKAKLIAAEKKLIKAISSFKNEALLTVRNAQGELISVVSANRKGHNKSIGNLRNPLFSYFFGEDDVFTDEMNALFDKDGSLKKVLTARTLGSRAVHHAMPGSPILNKENNGDGISDVYHKITEKEASENGMDITDVGYMLNGTLYMNKQGISKPGESSNPVRSGIFPFSVHIRRSPSMSDMKIPVIEITDRSGTKRLLPARLARDGVYEFDQKFDELKDENDEYFYNTNNPELLDEFITTLNYALAQMGLGDYMLSKTYGDVEVFSSMVKDVVKAIESTGTPHLLSELFEGGNVKEIAANTLEVPVELDHSKFVGARIHLQEVEGALRPEPNPFMETETEETSESVLAENETSILENAEAAETIDEVSGALINNEDVTLETLEHIRDNATDEATINAATEKIAEKFPEASTEEKAPTEQTSTKETPNKKKESNAQSTNDKAKMMFLANNGDDSVRLKLASNPNISAYVAKKLIEIGDEDTLIALAKNKKVDISVLEELSLHESSEVRVAIIENGRMNPAIFANLSQTTNAIVLNALASSPNLTVEQMNELASSHVLYTVVSLISNKKIPVSVLDIIIKSHPGSQVVVEPAKKRRSELLGSVDNVEKESPYNSLSTFEKLLFIERSTDVEFLDMVANDTSVNQAAILKRVLANENTSDATILKILKSETISNSKKAPLTSRKSPISSEALDYIKSLSTDGVSGVDAIYIKQLKDFANNQNESTQSEDVSPVDNESTQPIVTDAEPSGEIATVEKASIEEDLTKEEERVEREFDHLNEIIGYEEGNAELLRLAKNGTTIEKIAVASSPNIGDSAIAALMDKKAKNDEAVFMALAGNPKISQAVITELMKRKGVTQIALANNPNLTMDQIEELAKSRNPYVQAAIFYSNRALENTMKRISNKMRKNRFTYKDHGTSSWTFAERLDYAKNGTSTNALESLASDSSPLVRHYAYANLNSNPSEHVTASLISSEANSSPFLLRSNSVNAAVSDLERIAYFEVATKSDHASKSIASTYSARMDDLFRILYNMGSYMRELLADNKFLTAEQYTELLKSMDSNVLSNLSRNENAKYMPGTDVDYYYRLLEAKRPISDNRQLAPTLKRGVKYKAKKVELSDEGVKPVEDSRPEFAGLERRVKTWLENTINKSNKSVILYRRILNSINSDETYNIKQAKAATARAFIISGRYNPKMPKIEDLYKSANSQFGEYYSVERTENSSINEAFDDFYSKVYDFLFPKDGVTSEDTKKVEDSYKSLLGVLAGAPNEVNTPKVTQKTKRENASMDTELPTRVAGENESKIISAMIRKGFYDESVLEELDNKSNYESWWRAAAQLFKSRTEAGRASIVEKLKFSAPYAVKIGSDSSMDSSIDVVESAKFKNDAIVRAKDGLESLEKFLEEAPYDFFISYGEDSNKKRAAVIMEDAKNYSVFKKNNYDGGVGSIAVKNSLIPSSLRKAMTNPKNEGEINAFLNNVFYIGNKEQFFKQKDVVCGNGVISSSESTYFNVGGQFYLKVDASENKGSLSSQREAVLKKFSIADFAGDNIFLKGNSVLDIYKNISDKFHIRERTPDTTKGFGDSAISRYSDYVMLDDFYSDKMLRITGQEKAMELYVSRSIYSGNNNILMVYATRSDRSSKGVEKNSTMEAIYAFANKDMLDSPSVYNKIEGLGDIKGKSLIEVSSNSRFINIEGSIYEKINETNLYAAADMTLTNEQFGARSKNILSSYISYSSKEHGGRIIDISVSKVKAPKNVNKAFKDC